MALRHAARLGLALALATAAVAVVRVSRDPVGTVPAQGFEALRASAPIVTSERCAICHGERTASWRRTFHRTMTQRAGAAAIVAPFDGRELDWLGVVSSPRRRAGGGFEIATSDPVTGRPGTFPVVFTVGSRRMQQYVTRTGDRHLRLPIAWSIVEQRWFHLSEAFFHPDGEPFHGPTAVWDLNCIFCHNVKPKPGFVPGEGAAGTLGPRGEMDSSVAETGIACEACHGPGGEHARRMRSPLRRLGFQWTDQADPTIVHPQRLDRRRSTQVCGHCHGQRVPARESDIRSILRDGDPYTPGEDLSRYFRPVTAETRIGAVDLAPRFWPDGSIRLTAYEYQGLLASACFSEGTLSCLSCHAMHAGEPHGQLRPDRPGDEICTQCHSEYRGPRLAAHTRHGAQSEGSRCVGCHMPLEVYGIMSWHPSHQIRSPDPRARGALRMPDACTSCHTGRSLAWAAAAAEAWWPELAQVRECEELPEEPEMIRALFVGDVVYRALAASRLGEDGPEGGVAHAAVPFLAELLLDSFPAVRRSAAAALRQATGGASVPFALDSVAARRGALARFSAWSEVAPGDARWPLGTDGRIDTVRLSAWRAERVEVEVPIGE